MIRIIDAGELRRLVPMSGAIDALAAAFQEEDASLVAPLRL